jgi:hypothetical protein
MTGIMMDSTVVVAKEQMSCGLDDEAVILSLKRGILFIESLWEPDMVPDPETGQSRDDPDTLLEEYDIDKETCEEDCLSLLSDLNHEGLIVVEDSSAS